MRILSRSSFVRGARASAAALVLLASPGCALFAGAPTSKLAAGEPVQSGQESYDAFFVSVADVSARSEGAKGEAPLRKELAETLGLGPGAKQEETLDAAKAKSAELKKDGGKFFVVVAPQPKLIVRKGTEESKEAATFAAAVEGTIKKGLERADELEGLAKEVASLEETLATLEQELEAKFPSEGEREQMALELGEAKKQLELARLRASAESGGALRFAVLLASAVDSGAAAELLAMEASGAKPGKGGRKGPAKPWGGAKPAGGGGAKPAKPAKPKQDFDP